MSSCFKITKPQNRKITKKWCNCYYKCITQLYQTSGTIPEPYAVRKKVHLLSTRLHTLEVFF